jgi:hypothetical protein
MDGDREQARKNPGDDQHPAPRLTPSQPRDRNNFEIAIMCALPLEASAVSALFDKRWDDQ